MKCMPISMYMEPNEPHHKERAYMSKVVVTAKLSNMENLNTRDKCYSSHPPSLTTIHVIGISNLIDDKIKKPIWSFACIVRRDEVNRAWNTSIKLREHRNILFIIISHNNQIAWLSQTHFRQIHKVHKGLSASFSWLCFSDADWQSRQTLITWIICLLFGGFSNAYQSCLFLAYSSETCWLYYQFFSHALSYNGILFGWWN